MGTSAGAAWPWPYVTIFSFGLVWLASALPAPGRGPGPALGIRTGSSRPGLIKVGAPMRAQEGHVLVLFSSSKV